jgi:hypothetical protein
MMRARGTSFSALTPVEREGVLCSSVVASWSAAEACGASAVGGASAVSGRRPPLRRAADGPVGVELGGRGQRGGRDRGKEQEKRNGRGSGGGGPTLLRGERDRAEMRSSIRASHLSLAKEAFSGQMGSAQLSKSG